MALPILGATFGGVIISSLAAFFATRGMSILASLGITAVVYSGLDQFLSYAISNVATAVSGGGSISFGGTSIDAMGILGAAGLWSAINIVLSGYATLVTIKASKLIFKGITS